jgi:hypothetical protein
METDMAVPRGPNLFQGQSRSRLNSLTKPASRSGAEELRMTDLTRVANPTPSIEWPSGPREPVTGEPGDEFDVAGCDEPLDEGEYEQVSD